MPNKEDQIQAFRSFDWEGDARWVQHLLGIEIPSNSDAVLQRLKARWYKKVVDPDLEVDWVAAAPTPSRPAAPPPPAPKPKATSTPDARPEPPQPSQRAYPPPSSTSTDLFAPIPGHPDNDIIARRVFAFHSALVLLGVVAVIPIPNVSSLAYTFFQRFAIITSGLRLFAFHGIPTLKPFSFQNIVLYLQRITPSNDFHFLLLFMLFPSSPPYLALLVPMWLVSLCWALGWLSRTFLQHPLWVQYGARVHAALRAKQHEMSFLSAGAEVLLGVLLVVSMLGGARIILLTFMYWNFLKHRYHMPGAGAAHKQLWSMVDVRVAPIVRRVGLLNTGVTAARNWFTQSPYEVPRRRT